MLLVSAAGIVVNAAAAGDDAVEGFSALRVLRLSRLIGLARVACVPMLHSSTRPPALQLSCAQSWTTGRNFTSLA